MEIVYLVYKFDLMADEVELIGIFTDRNKAVEAKEMSQKEEDPEEIAHYSEPSIWEVTVNKYMGFVIEGR